MLFFTAFSKKDFCFFLFGQDTVDIIHQNLGDFFNGLCHRYSPSALLNKNFKKSQICALSSVHDTRRRGQNQVSRDTETSKTRNQTQYNASSVNRGDVAFRFSDGVLKLWNRKNQNCRRGRPFVYGDTAIETSPTVAIVKQTKAVVSDIEADS